MDDILDQFDAAEPEFETEIETEPVPTTLDIDIDPPITFAKKTFTTMHLREPRAGDTQKALTELAHGTNPYTSHRFATRLVASVSGVPIEVVLMMPESQVQRAMGFFERIGASGPETGES